MKHTIGLLIPMFLTMSFFSGCGGNGDATSNDESQSSITIAYSDWPGWVAWEIGIQKGFFKEAGVDVKFEWLDYVASMDAFASNKVDAVCMTNGDGLVTGATGKKGIGILLNDFSNGNDMVVASADIKSIADLKGKKIGVETGFVSHLLLLKALESAGLSESDVEIINVPTDQTPQALETGDVHAISAWQPHSGLALKKISGSKALFTSADIPGLIYDVLFVSPESLTKNRSDWEKVVQVWGRIVEFMNDSENKDEMLSILSARVQITPDEYAPLLAGTRILNLKENAERFSKGDGFTTVYGSSQIVNQFNVDNKVYETAEEVDTYFDSSLLGN